MTHDELMTLAMDAVRCGAWMIRGDDDGESYGGFRWAAPGEWTEAPDWNPEPVCGGGLHGQDRDNGGYAERRSRLVFCETDGPHVAIGSNKMKCRRARILLVNALPAGLTVDGSLDLSGCPIAELPAGLTVGGSLYLGGCPIAELPADLNVGGSLNLRGCPIAELPAGLTVGGSLDLSDCPIAELPAGLTVGGWLDLRDCPIASLPPDLTVGGKIYTDEDTVL